MAACEGVLLVIDAAQGVEAQTVANTYLAVERGLEIIPVINKIELPNADIPLVKKQLEDIFAIDAEEALEISAKTGLGVESILEAVIERIPAPKTTGKDVSTRALVFDSVYDAYRGVVTYVRIVDGTLKHGERVHFIGSKVDTVIKELGTFGLKPEPAKTLEPGQVGYMVGTIKTPSEIRIGDTLTVTSNASTDPLPGFKDVHPMVFSGLYPVDGADYEKFRDSLERLALNDSSLIYHPESSIALGFGFRCGFLGLLHLEITLERLRREHDVDIISTYPAVVYRVFLRDGVETKIDNPMELPDPTRVERIDEPMVRTFIISPNEHIGDIMKLVMDRRGEVTQTDSIDTHRVMLTCTMPLNEILIEFHDTLKSISRGYASLDYEYSGYMSSEIVRLEFLLNGDPIDAFATLVHRSKAEARGRQICLALKEAIPRHQFPIAVQASIGSTVIARETIRAFRKDVTEKLYGGDVTRKQKLLKKQKAGKKRMKQFGNVNVPHEAFVAVMKTG